MAFKGITFSGQNVSPKNDHGLYMAHNTDGVLWGCGMEISGDGNSLTIQSGEFIAGGTVVQVDGATSVDLSGRQITTGYIQVIFNIDLTQAEGEQWYTSFVEDDDTTFNALTQEAIWSTGELYQIELAIVQVIGGNLGNIYSRMRTSGLSARGLDLYDGNIRIFRGGTLAGHLNVSDNGTIFNVAKVVNNASAVGVYGDSTNAGIIYSANGLFLRPNGVNDPSGQAKVNSDGSVDVSGQIKGGHPITNKTRSSVGGIGSSLVAITNAITGLDSSGVYVVSAKLTYKADVNTKHYPLIGIGSTAETANLQVWDMKYCESTGDRYFGISGIVTGLSQVVLAVATLTGSVTATVKDAELRIVRLH